MHRSIRPSALMDLPRFVGTFGGDVPVIWAVFFKNMHHRSGDFTIDVDKCSWPQKALIWINRITNPDGIYDIVPMQYVDLFYGPCEIHFYPLVKKLVVSQEQYLSYLERFSVYEDVLCSLNRDEKVRYIADQFDIDLDSSRCAPVSEYFDGCFHEYN